MLKAGRNGYVNGKYALSTIGMYFFTAIFLKRFLNLR